MFLGSAVLRTVVAALVVSQMVMAQQQNSQAAQDKIVHLNQIQVIGSHNSYHAGFAVSEQKYLEMTNQKNTAKPGLSSCSAGGSALRRRETG